MNINSRFVKFLRKKIVNLQSGEEYLFQIRECKIPKKITVHPKQVLFVYEHRQTGQKPF